MSYFANLHKKIGWSLLITVFLGAIAIYTDFFRNNNPLLIIELISETNVLDLKEDVPALTINYGNVDIKSRGETLSVILFRISNTGRNSIQDIFYASDYPLGINLKTEGSLLKVEKVSAVTDYLQSKAIPYLDNNKRIIFLPKVILDSNDSYIIKALVLHPSASNVDFDVTGKIANIKEITYEKLNNESDSVLQKVTQGSILVHITRAILYFLILIVFLLLTLVIAYILEYWSKRKRNKIVGQYKKYKNDDIKDYHKTILDSYTQDGLIHLAEMKSILSDNDKSKHYINIIKNEVTKNDYEEVSYSKFRKTKKTDIAILLRKLEILFEDNNGNMMINKEIQTELDKFIEFVVIKES